MEDSAHTEFLGRHFIVLSSLAVVFPPVSPS